MFETMYQALVPYLGSLMKIISLLCVDITIARSKEVFIARVGLSRDLVDRALRGGIRAQAALCIQVRSAINKQVGNRSWAGLGRVEFSEIENAIRRAIQNESESAYEEHLEAEYWRNSPPHEQSADYC